MSLPRFSVAQRLHPHPFTITMQVTTLSLLPQIPFISWAKERTCLKIPRACIAEMEVPITRERVIVRLTDRLLRIRADLTDAVDSAYSDLCSRP